MPQPGWHVGDVWEPLSVCTNPKSATPEKPVKPGSWTFTFKSPRGVETKPTVTEVAEGEAEAAQKLTEQGPWIVSVTTTSPFEASQPASIVVRPKFGE